MRFGLPSRQTEREDFAAEPQRNNKKKDRRCGPG